MSKKKKENTPSELSEEVNEDLIEEDKKDKKKSSSKQKSSKTKGDSKNTSSKNNKPATRKKNMVPKTVQQSIPYVSVYKNGMIETSPGTFSKSYILDDVNFRIATEEEQINTFAAFEELLNAVSDEVRMEITINNRNLNRDQFYRDVLLEDKKDGLDVYRDEYNQMLKDKLEEGHNNIVREKYVTLSCKAGSPDEAVNKFARLDTDISSAIKKITGNEVSPMTIAERLSVLHDIYNVGSVEPPFYREENINGRMVKLMNLDEFAKLGVTSKDLIGPPQMTFDTDCFTLGDKYGQTLYIDNLPAFLGVDTLTDIAENPCNMVTSIHYQSLRQDKAIKLVSNQIVNINSNVIDAQKKATKGGYSTELISPDLKKAQLDAEDLMKDLTSRNQKLFLVSILVTHFADDKDQLKKQFDMISSAVAKHICSLKTLPYQQERAFNSSLPLGENKTFVQRMLTTESAAVFMPFSVQELSQNHGMYYGLNAVSRNMILFNRKYSKNANGMILGTPGSGKSFSAKREIVNILLNTNDYVYVIDPEREYAPLAGLLGGTIVHIAPGGSTHINPMDMDVNYADDDSNPIPLMSSFICSICETVLGGQLGLTPTQKTVIDRCVNEAYKPYMATMAARTDGVTFDRTIMPTLVDLYDLLVKQPEPDAYSIALALELYTKGTLNTFSQKTNVDVDERFVIYDIKDLGAGMKELGLQVCLNNVWNKIIANSKQDIYTWFYIDEIYLLTQRESSATFLQEIFKRARKWKSSVNGITQNVTDLLASQFTQTMLSNCDFIMMLNQAPVDRVELAKMFNISTTQLSYITNADSGQGLIYTGKTIIPFVDKFPIDTQLYRVMTTKAVEDLPEAKPVDE